MTCQASKTFIVNFITNVCTECGLYYVCLYPLSSFSKNPDAVNPKRLLLWLYRHRLDDGKKTECSSLRIDNTYLPLQNLPVKRINPVWS